MIRVAILGISHWHAEGYIRALQAFDAEFVGVSDAEAAAARRWGVELGCPAYAPSEALLAEVRPDLIFAFAPHDEMTDLASVLVAEGVPFVMEKPMGVRWEALAAVARLAEAKRLWAGVDLVVRTLGLAKHLLSLRDSSELGAVTAYTYRLLGGSPQRYLEWGVPWMLDPARSGGGPLYNFGPHVLDIFLRLTGEPIQELHCWTSHRLHRLEIEDYAIISARSASGALGNMVVGYVCPATSEKFFALATDRLWVSSSSLASGTIHWRNGQTTEVSASEGEDWALAYVRETLRRFHTGEPPVATIGEMVPILRAINRAQELAEGPVTMPSCEGRTQGIYKAS